MTTLADPINPSPQLLTVKEAAAELRCSLSFIYKQIKLRKLTIENRGRRKLIPAASIAEYRQYSTIAAQSTPPYAADKPRLNYAFKHLFKDTKISSS